MTKHIDPLCFCSATTKLLLSLDMFFVSKVNFRAQFRNTSFPQQKALCPYSKVYKEFQVLCSLIPLLDLKIKRLKKNKY